MICPTVFGAWWRTWLMKAPIGRNRLLYRMWYAAKGARSVQLRTVQDYSDENCSTENNLVGCTYRGRRGYESLRPAVARESVSAPYGEARLSDRVSYSSHQSTPAEHSTSTGLGFRAGASTSALPGAPHGSRGGSVKASAVALIPNLPSITKLFARRRGRRLRAAACLRNSFPEKPCLFGILVI